MIGQSSSRRHQARPRVAVSTYWMDVTPPCEGNCTLVAWTKDAYQLDVDRLSSRKPTVILRRLSDQKLMKTWKVAAAPASGRSGNAFTLETQVARCTGKDADAYFRVYDDASKRWSAPKYVAADCDDNYPL